MQKRRIFIAINLPENIKKRLADYQNKWPELPARWTKEANIHITLEFLGYITDEELLEVSDIVKAVAENNSSFLIDLTNICYGPLHHKDAGQAPRMVWIIGEKSEELNYLKNDLSEKLGTLKIRQFIPHITLARINKWNWQRIEPEERPEINEDINLSFEVNSVEIMESVLKRGGPEYSILQSFNLKQ